MATSTLDSELAIALLDKIPEPVLYYIPVWAPAAQQHTLSDFEVAYCNNEAAVFMGVTKNELLGQRVRSIVATDEEMRLRSYQQLQLVYETGVPQEDAFTNRMLNRHLLVLRTKVDDGVLVVLRNKTQEVREHEEKKQQIALADSILDTSLNGIFACEALRDASGKIVDLEMKRINKAFMQMIHLPEEKVIGNTYLTLFPSSLENGTFAMNCRVIETGESSQRQVYYKGDNLDAWYDVSMSKLGQNGLLVSFSDITEQKKAYLQIEQQNVLLDNILKHSANGISVTEVYRDQKGDVIDGQTIVANDAAVRFTGIPREIYLSKRATELEPNIIHSPYFQLCIKTLQTGAPQFSQYYMESTSRWLEISISKLDDDHIITIFTDITQAKEFELHQQQLVEDLKRSNSSLEEFAHAASHDLKEPVRKVHFFTDRLKEKLGDRLTAEELQLFGRIETATERMRLLIDDLLEYSHVSHTASNLEEVDLNNKLRLVLMDLEIPIMEKGATVTVGPLPTIKGYRRQLQQLFQNLISNALKYSKEDEKPVIQITSHDVLGQEAGINLSPLELQKPFHLIEVKDNGIGFEQNDAERIFNMFQRLHGKSEYSGTGVGLAIVRKVVNNHGGYIWAESEPGAGATFKLLLPAE